MIHFFFLSVINNLKYYPTQKVKQHVEIYLLVGLQRPHDSLVIKLLDWEIWGGLFRRNFKWRKISPIMTEAAIKRCNQFFASDHNSAVGRNQQLLSSQIIFYYIFIHSNFMFKHKLLCKDFNDRYQYTPDQCFSTF